MISCASNAVNRSNAQWNKLLSNFYSGLHTYTCTYHQLIAETAEVLPLFDSVHRNYPCMYCNNCFYVSMETTVDPSLDYMYIFLNYSRQMIEGWVWVKCNASRPKVWEISFGGLHPTYLTQMCFTARTTAGIGWSELRRNKETAIYVHVQYMLLTENWGHSVHAES